MNMISNCNPEALQLLNLTPLYAKERLKSRFLLCKEDGRLAIRSMTSGELPPGLPAGVFLPSGQEALVSDLHLQYQLYGFWLSYRSAAQESTYQGTLLFPRFGIEEAARLLSVFDSAIVEQRESCFAVTARLKTGSASAYQSYLSLFETGRLQSFLTYFTENAKGRAESFEQLYRLESREGEERLSLTPEEHAFLAFLREQIQYCGYFLLPLPGLEEAELAESAALSKLSRAGRLYVVSKSGPLCSQYLLFLP